MADEKSPLDRVADAFFYVPLGAAIWAAENLPKLIDDFAERGREVLGDNGAIRNQLAVVRDLGEVALRQLRRQVQQPTRAEEAPAARGGNGESAIRQAQARVGRTLQEVPGSEPNGKPETGLDAHRAEVAEAREEAERLAIPDYESLSAAQVNARLAALTPEELRAVQQYEEGHRGRRTILSRIQSLLAEAG